MNFMKKWQNTYKHNLDNITYNKPYHSAGHINTSSAGTMIGLISAHKGYNAIIGLILITAFVSVVALNNGTVSATASTLSLSVSDDTISMDIAATRANGTFMKSTNTTITASTTNATGYELRIAASNATNPSALINTTDTNAKLNSISSATTESEFKALAGTTYNGKWGYLPSKYNSSTNTDFLPAPTTAGDIINKTECANGVSPCPAEDNYTLAIGARVDSSIKLGTYNNTFVILATANAIPYSITYDDNTITNMPVDVSSTSVSTTVPISSQAPQKSGYTFLGWCDTTPTNTNGTDTCSGTQYAPGDNYTIDQTGTNNLHLYAMWQRNLAITDLNYMQDFNSLTAAQKTSVLNSMPTGQKHFLFDKRDNEAYAIAKLADGKVWLLDNLRLDPTELTQAELYGSAQEPLTNASETTLGYLKNGGGTSPYPANGVISSSWQNSYDNPYINTDDRYTTAPVTYGKGSGKIGVYYNYCAASAGSYCYASEAGTGNATEDLCPAGWRFPTSDDTTYNGEYRALAVAYGWNQTASDAGSFQYNLSTPLSGGYWSGSAHVQGEYGYFWSSTFYDGNYMRNLTVYATGVSPSSFSYRYDGFSVRCVLDD